VISEFCIKRDAKMGGDKIYTAFEELEKDFAEEVESLYEHRYPVFIILSFFVVCCYRPNETLLYKNNDNKKPLISYFID